jgi:hypothetical protein
VRGGMQPAAKDDISPSPIDWRADIAWWRPAPAADAARASDRGVPGAPSYPQRATPFAALICFTFVLVIGPQFIFTALAPLRLAFVAAIVATATHLLDWVSQRERGPLLGPETRIAAWLVAWAILTIPWSYWPGGSVSFLLEFYLKTLVIFWLLTKVVSTPSRLRMLTWATTLFAVIPAVTGIRQHYSGVFVGDQSLQRIAGYAAPLTENPNDLALFLNLILPHAAGLLLGVRRPAGRVLLLGIILVFVAAIILSFSRAGFLMLATSAIVFQWRLWKWSKPGIACAMLIAMLACVSLFPAGYAERLGTITAMETDETGSAQGRWASMIAATGRVMKHPIVGSGVGMDVLAMNEEMEPTWHNVHNVYLQYAIDLGIPGVALFVVLLVASLRCANFACRRYAKMPGTEGLLYLGEGFRASLIVFVVGAFFSPVAYHFYFYYIAGLSIAAKTVSLSFPKNEDSAYGK